MGPYKYKISSIAMFAVLSILLISIEPIEGMTCIAQGDVYSDQTLSQVLIDRGIPFKAVNQAISRISSVLDMGKIYPGDHFSIEYDSLENLLEFKVTRSRWEKYTVKRIGDTFQVAKDTIPLRKVIFSAQGVVENTLSESMFSKSIEMRAIYDFTDVLAYDIDFNTETRNGDRFKIVYEKLIFRDEIVGIGKILLAEYSKSYKERDKETKKLVGRVKTYTAIYYSDPTGTEGYYNLKGKSMKKSHLKCPLVFSRISSHFSFRRFHPILKKYRPHMGIDYAAPIGTPVSASGSGTVVYCGWKGGFGKFIHIKHPGKDNIETMYGHLSRFTRGIRKGVKVKRGQVIGYVGYTGLSTGPHLDYRVKVNGKFVNPEKYAFPTGPPVKKKYLEIFKKYADSIIKGVQIFVDANSNNSLKKDFSLEQG